MSAQGWSAGEFKAVYARNVRAVFSFLSRRVGADEAEELTAQTFLDAWAVRGRYRAELGSELSWLYGIAVNLLRHHYRHEERRDRAFRTVAGRQGRTEDLADEAEVDDRVDAEQRWPVLAGAIDRLTPDEREIFVLYALGDLTYQGIADRLGIPVGTVRSRLSRCRARMTAHHPLEQRWVGS